MHFNKRGNKATPNYNEEQPSSLAGSRMRITEQRSPFRIDKDTGESGYAEMLYLDPSDVNFRRNQAMSPTTEGRQSRVRSPMGQSVITSVRNEFNERGDTAGVMGRRPIPTFNVNFNSRNRENLSRSPKTINIGESEKDVEYNIKTLGAGRSPKLTNSINPLYQTYSNNEPGNIFLDQPMSSFVQGQTDPGYQSSSPAGMLPSKSGDYTREIQYSMNPRDLREPIPNIMNKMSPNKNVDDESTSDMKGNDTATQLKDLKNQMYRNTNMHDGDGMVERPRELRTDIEKIDDYIRTKDVRETLSEGEVKKIMRQITKGYDPRKGDEGRLISTSQTIIPGESEDVFNDRYRVLQKMNKLSTILLAKNRNSSTNDSPQLNRSIDEQRKTFDRNTLNSAMTGKNRRTMYARSPQNRFLYLSLAMISSKGPHCEDRIILRKMRFDKGGVVDLAQEAQKKKNKFQVRKITRKTVGGSKITMNYNPKYRDKAARIVQGWWRDLKERYQKVLSKIILIQSIWRGRWLRKYIYDIIYLSFLHQRFIDIVEKVMVNHIRPEVWEQLFAQKKWAKEFLARLLMEKDPKFTALRIRPYFNKWRDTARHLSKRALKSKRLVNRRELDEKNKKLLAKNFNDWAVRSLLLKYMRKNKDAEEQKKKFFGLLSLVKGTDTLAKRNGLDTVNPHLQSYLAKKIRDNALKSLLLKNPKYKKLVLRKYMNKWKDAITAMKLRDFKEALFGRMCGRLNSRINKNNLRDAFGYWKSQVPKDKYYNYSEGADTLQRFVFRRTHKDPLKALHEKIDYENEKDGILRMLGVKSRYIKNHWREYLYKWRTQAQKLKDKEIQNKLYKSLLNTQLNKRRNRILSNRFNQWRKTPKVDMEAIFDRYRRMNDMIKKTVDYVLKPTKKDFLDRTSQMINPKSFKLAGQRLYEKYVLRDRMLLRYYLYKWRDQCKNMEIYDLKVQLFRYLCGGNDKKNRKNLLHNKFNKWKMMVNDGRNEDYINKLKNISDGFDKLSRLTRKHPMDFIRRLYRLLNKDYRPKFMEKVVNALFKPRATVRDCFNKWRRVNDIENSNSNLRNLKGKLLKSNANKLNSRLNRDMLITSFFKWKNLARNPDDYYPKIAEGGNKLRAALRKRCQEPLDKIKGTRNYARKLIPLLKNNKNLQNRLNKDMMRSALSKWKDIVNKDHMNLLKSSLLYKTKNGLLSIQKKKNLQKYFTQWKNNKPQTINTDFYKGLMLLQNYCERPFRRDVLNAFAEKVNDILKRQGLNGLFGVSKTFRAHIMRDALNKWWKKAMLTDPNKYKRIRTRMRMLVKEKSELPIEKAFHKWIRQLAKNPDYVNIVNGSDKLKSALVKANKPAYDKIKNYVSPEYIRRKIFKNVLPNSKLAKNRVLRNALNKWKDNVNKLNMLNLKTNLLTRAYTRNKGALRDRLLREYLKRWSYKEPEEKPIDYLKVIQGNNIISKTLTNKYMKGFLGDLDKYGKDKFLRSLLLGTSKYHLRRLKPFFDRWRSIANKLAARLLSQKASILLMSRFKNSATQKRINDLLRSKFNQWKDIVNYLKDLEKKNIPEAAEHIKKTNILKNGQPLIDELKDKSLKNKKKKALKSMPKRRKAGELNKLKNFMDRWNKQVHKMLLNDMKNALKYRALRNLYNLYDNGLMKYFTIWRTKAGFTKSTSPIQQGADVLRKAVIRQPFKKFIKKADMLNLKIPRGLSTQTALIRKKRNLAKSICLRNVSIRPMWNRWKRGVVALRNKAIRRKLFDKTICPVMKNMDKLILRRGYNTWKDNANKLAAHEKLQQMQLKLLTMLCGKNAQSILRKYFDKWMKNCGMMDNRGKNAMKACEKLRQFASKPIINQIRKALLNQGKYDRVRALMTNAFRNNDRGNLAYCFNKWRKVAQKLRELFLKSRFLRALAGKQDLKNGEYLNHKVHECLLKWRINCAPDDFCERAKKISEGCRLLEKGVRVPHNRKVFNGIKRRADARSKHSLLNKLINSLGPKGEYLMKKRAFNTWRDRIGDTDAMKRKMKELLERYLVSEPMHNKMIKQPVDDICDMMTAYYKLKKQKAKPICDFCRGLVNIRKQFNILKRSRALRNRMNKLDLMNLAKYHNAFTKWLRRAKALSAEENAKTIQKFLKSKLNNPSDKRKRVARGADLLSQYIKRITYNKIKDAAKDNLMKRVLRRHIDNQDKMNKKVLGDAFRRWKDLMPLLRQIDSAIKIQSGYRALKAKKKADELRRRQQKLKYIMLTLMGKNADIKATYFHKWLLQMLNIRCNENAYIIQRFIDDKLKKLLKAKAMKGLNELFVKYVVKQLCDKMKKASKITGDRGAVMYNTLEDIYIRRPFDKLCNAMKWIGRVKQLRKIMPQLQRALRNYWLPYNMGKWKRNTWDDKMNKLALLQNWIRTRLNLLRQRAALKKNNLLNKFLRNLTKNNELKLLVPFKIWHKKAQYDKLNDTANAIQKVFRGGKARKAANKGLNQKKLNDLFKKAFKKKVADTINEADKFSSPLRKAINALSTSQPEKRYTTNNLIDFANDALRNKYLLTLTGKLAYTDGRSALRRYFDRWRQLNSFMNNAATKLNNAARCKMANKRLNRLKKLKNMMYKLFLRYCDDDKEKLRSTLRKWNNTAQYRKCDYNSGVIGKFLRPRLAKLLNDKFKEFFTKNAPKLAKHRINQEGKLNKLRNAIMKPFINHFTNCLRNKDKFDKLRLIFAKNFSHLDEQLLKILMDKYFKTWKSNANKLTKKLNDDATTIQTNFRGYLARKKLAQLRAKRDRLYNIFLELMNSRDHKKRAAFNKWRNNANKMKMNESSEIIQDFMGDVKKKLKSRKDNRKKKNIEKGLNILANMKPNMKEPFDKIKSESNRKLFSKFVDDMDNKRKDHLKTAYDAIKEAQKNYLLNKLFKVPERLRLKILRKALNKWRDNADKIAKKHSAEMIQKNYRLYMQRKKQSKIDKLIRERLAYLAMKNGDILRYYFNKWLKNAKKMKVLRSGRKISKFCNDKLKDFKAAKNWHKLSDLLNLHNGNLQGINLLKKMRQYLAIAKLTKPIEHRIKQDEMDDLKDMYNQSRLRGFLKKLFGNFENRNDLLNMRKCLRKWRDKAMLMKAREDALNKAVDAMDNRRVIIAADTVNSACLVKKLFHDIPRARALNFFDRLRRIAEDKKKLRSLGDNLVKAKNDLVKQNSNVLADKIYKLFIYKKLNKMFNKLQGYLINKVKPEAGRDFLDRLYDNLQKNSYFNYDGEKSSTFKCPNLQLSFKKRVTNPKNKVLESTKLGPVKRLMPFFVNYLANKIKQRKKDVMDTLAFNDRYGKFCSLYKKFSNKKMLPQKEDLVNELKNRSAYMDTQGMYLINLFKLLRKGFVHKVCESLKEPSRIYQLLYLIRITTLHKKVARQRYIRELIRKWRFAAFVKKMARKKLEMMYKNLHVSYLQMANEVFGDEDEVNPSVIKEFERFGTSVGMFSSEEPSLNEEISKKYYQKVQKKYVFKPSVIEEESKPGKSFVEEKDDDEDEK